MMLFTYWDAIKHCGQKGLLFWGLSCVLDTGKRELIIIIMIIIVIVIIIVIIIMIIIVIIIIIIIRQFE